MRLRKAPFTEFKRISTTLDDFSPLGTSPIFMINNIPMMDLELRNSLPHSLMRYYDPSYCVKYVCRFSQGCFHPCADALLFHIIRIMLSVAIIGRSRDKRISAVLADISLYPEYCSVLQLPYTGAILHNVPGKTLRAHGIHVAYEIMIPELKIHHWYVIDHEI